MNNLTDPNEKTLFFVLLILSVCIWIGLIAGTVGVMLIFILIGFIIFLFAQSRLIAYLRGTGAIVTPEQYPDLHAMFEECCKKLEMDKPPTMILMHMDGMFNAFATRFLRKNYVVLLSDIVDALEEEPEAIKFYIGHELGHIKRKHLIWGPVLAPASWLPLIGSGYSRAREFTCDQHGLACCNSNDAAIKAMAALAVGGKRWKTLNIKAYLEQKSFTKGFWMSLHELTSDYPWLVRRIARLHDKGTHEHTTPRRNPFAWILALFLPRFNFMSLIILYVLILGAIEGGNIYNKIVMGQDQAAEYEGYYEQEDYGYDEGSTSQYQYQYDGQ